ncbi:MAG: PhoH family protein [Lachnospiraceae bacterium]|nr:PhoH family protein [Lachnospiraceae bacterium]
MASVAKVSVSYNRRQPEENMVQLTADIDAQQQKVIFGPFDTYMKKIERSLDVSIHVRDGQVFVTGSPDRADKTVRVLNTLSKLIDKGNELTEQNIDYAIAMTFSEKENTLVELDSEMVCRTLTGKPIKPKTAGQKEYIDAIRNNLVVFGVGPAGTGKTYLAMAMAIQAFKDNQVQRIILTRPAIEAGEKLGFLPGDLQSKVDPYLRPLYDALYQIMGAESFAHNMEKGAIEVAPLAYMRGRTLDNSYIILDEAQNTTPAQMKMFLTRIGFNSKVIVTGDLTQKDLPSGTESGLDNALSILKDIEGIGIVKLTNLDVVRHPLVQRIVEAYEKHDNKVARAHAVAISKKNEKKDHHDNRY